MSPPEIWGPPIWKFLHTLAEKIQEDKYSTLSAALIFHIRRIVAYLPCPDCSRHATSFFSKLPPNKIKTKTDLKNALFVLHNLVNQRKHKPLAEISILDTYRDKTVVQTYEEFIKVYKTRGNMELLTESFQRQLVVSGLKKWLLTNIRAFQ